MITIRKAANGYIVSADDPSQRISVDMSEVYVALSPSELWFIAFELLEGRKPQGNEATPIRRATADDVRKSGA